MHHRQRKAVVGVIGHIAGEHLVKQDAEAVQISAGVYVLAANLLWTHVARSADGQAGAGHPGGAAQGFGDAKVGQHRAAVFAEQDILRLDIAMNNAAMVRVVQGFGDGAGHRHRLFQRQTLADALLQRAAGQILHRQIINALVRGDVVDRDDMRIAELGDDPAFPQETLGEFFISGQNRLDDFQRDMTMQRLLQGEIDNRHAALAEFALNLIAWNVHVQVLLLRRCAAWVIRRYEPSRLGAV